jgi:hypothetical protein
LDENGIPWHRLPSGALDLSRDTFRQQANTHPLVQPLHELRTTLSDLRLNDIAVGADGRNRTLLSPFRSATGRNQPSNAKFLFGPSRWIRGLIRPPAGYGLAYVDWSAQEIAIAAALSGDEGMINGYISGDPYLAFAKSARLVPPEATKLSHKVERDRCKAVVLGVNYGMAERSLAASTGITELEARYLLRLHRRTYPRFWQWSDEVVATAVFAKEMTTCFGWHRHVGPDANPRSLMNWPMQAHGAEMMRLAAIAATEAGIEVCAPVHDAFLICAPLEYLDERVLQMRQIMGKAASAVTGFEIRTDAGLTKILANVVLSKFDRQVQRANIEMIRYVDDLLLFFPSKAAAMTGHNFIKAKLEALELDIPAPSESSKTEIIGPREPVDFLGREIVHLGSGNKHVARVSRRQIAKIVLQLEEDYTYEARRKQGSNFQETIVDLWNSVATYLGIYRDAYNFVVLDSELRRVARKIIGDIFLDVFGENALDKVTEAGRDFLGIGQLDVPDSANDLES